jgi:hypothetical protein
LLAAQPGGHAGPGEWQFNHPVRGKQADEAVGVLIEQQFSPLLQDLRGGEVSRGKSFRSTLVD